MNKHESPAIDAVAAHFSAKWKAGEAGSDAMLSLGGRRIALRVVTIRRRKGADPAKPRLRFDKVAIELVDRLQTRLTEAVPDGTTVMATVTAPIRLSGKTALEIEYRIRPLLARRAAEFEDTILGNDVRVRIANTGAAYAPKVAGFVHNPGLDTHAFLDVVQSLIAGIGDPAESPGARWLVLIDEHARWPVETYRPIIAQLATPSEFEKTLLVRGGSCIEVPGKIN